MVHPRSGLLADRTQLRFDDSHICHKSTPTRGSFAGCTATMGLLLPPGCTARACSFPDCAMDPANGLFCLWGLHYEPPVRSTRSDAAQPRSHGPRFGHRSQQTLAVVQGSPTRGPIFSWASESSHQPCTKMAGNAGEASTRKRKDKEGTLLVSTHQNCPPCEPVPMAPRGPWSPAPACPTLTCKGPCTVAPCD